MSPGADVVQMSDHFFEDDYGHQRGKLTKKEKRRIRLQRRGEEVEPARAVPISVKPLAGKTEKQKKYIEMIRNKEQVFVTGSAGTGKTYIPAAMAADMLRDGLIDKIVITRPNVAAGESIGFFPGSLEEKMAPWVAPLTSVLCERLGPSYYKNLLKNERIEIVPFEVMKGRTFKNSFVILDEAQNCRAKELKMFLTRVGDRSKVVVNGDIRQCDLEAGSGLSAVLRLIKQHRIDAGVIEFTQEDIVRSGICKQWVCAFEAEGI